MLPPADRQADDVTRLLDNPILGLPEGLADYPSEDYKAKLQLDAISQPTIGAGIDRFGAYAGGGISFMFSDVLGDHLVGANVQATSRLDETGGSLFYLNRKSRWNWGFVAEQLPYVTGGFGQGRAIVDGREVIVEQTLRERQINSGGSFIVQYPFSKVRRVEFAAGGRRIGFDSQIETLVFSANTGDLINEQVEELPRPDAINLAETSAALVYDTSIGGATGPILGQRYRLELSQSAGTLNFTGVLADYRKYVMPLRPFTFAVRALHYGRYGPAVKTSGSRICSWGSKAWCAATTSGRSMPTSASRSICRSCEAFDRMLGSRVGIVSARDPVPAARPLQPAIVLRSVPARDGVLWRCRPGVDLDGAADVRRRRSRLGPQRRRRAARERAGLRDRRDRLRPAVRSLASRLGLAVRFNAWILMTQGAKGARVPENVCQNASRKSSCLGNSCAEAPSKDDDLPWHPELQTIGTRNNWSSLVLCARCV